MADCLRRKKILSTSVVRKLFNSFGKLKKCLLICLGCMNEDKSLSNMLQDLLRRIVIGD